MGRGRPGTRAVGAGARHAPITLLTQGWARAVGAAGGAAGAGQEGDVEAGSAAAGRSGARLPAGGGRHQGGGRQCGAGQRPAARSTSPRHLADSGGR